MKLQICVIVLILSAVSCTSPQSENKPAQEILEDYSQQSTYTDPGEFLYLYENLPDSYSQLCSLIKKQLIHPLEARDMKDILPEGRVIEDGDFFSVEAMLAGLIKRDNRGLILDRTPENRLVVACYHHALLLASMLRSNGIPVRLRAGFARYFEKKTNVRFGHVICEVWDEQQERWIWVDPDREFVDFKKNQFELPAETWKNLRKNWPPKVKYVAALMEEEQAVLHILLLDQLFVMADEQLYWYIPSFLYKRDFSFHDLNEKELLVFDRIADLLSEPDNSFNELQKIYTDNAFIHPQQYGFEEFYEALTGKPIEDINK